ncbi:MULTISPECIES: tetratricopeptide repeat protein [Rhodanobacter]|uniref:Tetratricopeptide repeat protein n=1 Tax=Rhodanobacter hydrolyticus TaxID=2250595 RepID=A0ABW8J7P0_9GAMM|nr:tetratricopeptide repeat protein [Rhodanobacter sp. 7MK24]MBD8881673.1 tetratricopeptide repeat protein [Rhodanobacter sp. 7MK24]
MKHTPLFTLLVGAALAFTTATMPAHADDSSKKQTSAYPNATRAEPKLDLKSEKDQKALNDGVAAVNSGDSAKATQVLQPIIDKSDSKYAQAFALYLMANVSFKNGDVKAAIDQSKRSLDIGVLPNDTYFQEMLTLAQMYAGDQQYQASLDTIAKWRTEGKSETADSYGLEGVDYYYLQKYPEAIAAIQKAKSLTDKPKDSWNQVLMSSYAESGQGAEASKMAQSEYEKNPSDSSMLHNASTILLQQQDYAGAIKILEEGRANGALKDEADWILLVKAYLMQAQNGGGDTKAGSAKALAAFDDGVAKGAIKPSADNYKLAGDAAMIGDDDVKAIGYYQKASPLATDGEVDMALGGAYFQEQKFSDAKKYLTQAIAKGVKHKGHAYMMLGESDRQLKDKAGAVAAVKQAALDPETADKAQEWLKKSGK